MSIVNDDVFGVMEYNHRWIKKEELTLWGLTYEVNVVAKAYKEKPITDSQRDAYKRFNAELSSIFENLHLHIIKYLSNVEKKLFTIEDIKSFITLKTILFAQDGNVVMLFDSLLDEENGIGVQIYPNIEVGPQDIFL